MFCIEGCSSVNYKHLHFKSETGQLEPSFDNRFIQNNFIFEKYMVVGKLINFKPIIVLMPLMG